MANIWQGVVEDRFDPLKLGRCRVRILGLHTTNKIDGDGIPTEHLPWATPSQPITSAAMNGIGTTPMGPVEGTWVFGFFRDGGNQQEPVMMGTFGGIPEKDYEHDPEKGFNDPHGTYPLTTHLGEPDTNRAARGGGALPVPLPGSLDTPGSEDSPHLVKKRKIRAKKVPIAFAGDISKSIANTSNSSLYSNEVSWNEPNPRYGGTGDSDVEYAISGGISSIYPFNHVRMSESGHIEEWDDTPTAERMHRYHKSGTFEEIQPDGTKVTKVMGNNYEIIMGGSNVQIIGACNVTVSSDARLKFEKDLVMQVGGDYHLNVKGDVRTRIGGNHVTEVIADRKTVVNGFDDLFVGTNSLLNVGIDRQISISGTKTETVNKQVTELYFQGLATVTGIGGHSMFSAGNVDISALLNLGLSSVLNYSKTTFGTSTETNTLLHNEICLGGRTETTTGLSNVFAGIYTNVSGLILLN